MNKTKKISILISIISLSAVFLIGEKINLFAQTLDTTINMTQSTGTTLQTDTTPPMPPLNLNFTNVTNTSVTLTWQQSTDADSFGQIKSGLKKYKIFKDNDATAFAESTSNYFIVNNLSPGTSHSFRVVASDYMENNSLPSNSVNVFLPNLTTTGTQTTNTQTTTSVVDSTSASPTVTNTTQSNTTVQTTNNPAPQQMYIDPASVTINMNTFLSFKVRSQISGVVPGPITWSISEAGGGLITSSGVYYAPSNPGIFHIFAKAPGYYDTLATVVVKSADTQPAVYVAPIPVLRETSPQAPEPTKVIVPTVKIQSESILPPPTLEKPTAQIESKGVENNQDATTPLIKSTDYRYPVNTNTKDVQIYNQTTNVPTTTIAREQIQNIAGSIDMIRVSIDENKRKLIKAVDEHIEKSFKDIGTTTTSTETKRIESIRVEILKDIDSRLSGTNGIATSTVKELETKIINNLDKIDNANRRPENGDFANSTSTRVVGDILGSLNKTVDEQTKLFKEQNGDLLYKDTNKDGISDYESLYLYNIDPVKPSPVTEVEGKKITAGEKVLLGYDPKSLDLVKVIPEDPSVSTVVATPAYTVKDVELVDKKNLVIKGQALPNSFVTVYIFSTPIIVLVKTDANGDWQYTLDKELETGDHRIYTASVSNSGKIIAKSSEFTFVKTAEAATLNSSPTVQDSSQVNKPGLFSNSNIYFIIGIFILWIGISVGLIGFSSRGSSGNNQ